jgi:hypothetical protein
MKGKTQTGEQPMSTITMDKQNGLRHVVQESDLRGAQALLSAGNSAAAYGAFLNIIEDDPGSVEAYHGAGYAQYQLGNLTAADDLLTRTLQIAPRNANALYLRGDIALALGEADQACSFFEQALAVNPDHSHAGTALAELQDMRTSTPHWGPPSDGVAGILLQDDSELSRNTRALLQAVELDARPRFLAMLMRPRGRVPLQSFLRAALVAFVGIFIVFCFAGIFYGAGTHKDLVAQFTQLIRQHLSSSSAPGGLSLGAGSVVAVLAVVGATVLVIFTALRTVTTRYRVSDGWLTVERGVFSATQDRIALWRITGGTLIQSLANRMTGEGTLLLDIHGQPPCMVTGIKPRPELDEYLTQLMMAATALRANPMVKGIIQ